MRFTALPIAGASLIEAEPIRDERGFFARVWCQEEFARQGFDARAAQANIGVSDRRGTLRGLHYQVAPDLETKLVRCLRGAVWDVIVDLRPESPTYRRWHGVELTGGGARALYVPGLCAHGYITLEDDTELWYQASVPYSPGSSRGVRYDDPALGIAWPCAAQVISERDRSWPLLAPGGVS
jgi:dTDP-4-dehydrorhamnose 3,5-epimerase